MLFCFLCSAARSNFATSLLSFTVGPSHSSISTLNSSRDAGPGAGRRCFGCGTTTCQQLWCGDMRGLGKHTAPAPRRLPPCLVHLSIAAAAASTGVALLASHHVLAEAAADDHAGGRHLHLHMHMHAAPLLQHPSPACSSSSKHAADIGATPPHHKQQQQQHHDPAGPCSAAGASMASSRQHRQHRRPRVRRLVRAIVVTGTATAVALAGAGIAAAALAPRMETLEARYHQVRVGWCMPRAVTQGEWQSMHTSLGSAPHACSSCKGATLHAVSCTLRCCACVL